VIKIIYIISIIGVVIDQISKIIIDKVLKLNDSIDIIDPFFNITYIRNTGAAWGIFSNNTMFLALISIMFLIFLIKYIKENQKDLTKLTSISLGILIGGLVGNLIDRVVRNYVIDFFDFQIFGYDFPVFNIADVLIVLAVILLMIEGFIGDDKNDSRRRKEKNRSVSK